MLHLRYEHENLYEIALREHRTHVGSKKTYFCRESSKKFNNKQELVSWLPIVSLLKHCNISVWVRVKPFFSLLKASFQANNFFNNGLFVCSNEKRKSFINTAAFVKIFSQDFRFFSSSLRGENVAMMRNQILLLRFIERWMIWVLGWRSRVYLTWAVRRVVSVFAECLDNT